MQRGKLFCTGESSEVKKKKKSDLSALICKIFFFQLLDAPDVSPLLLNIGFEGMEALVQITDGERMAFGELETLQCPGSVVKVKGTAVLLHPEKNTGCCE